MTRRDYGLVTAGYWAFTLTDGALRMLVLLHFHELDYSPVSLAFLFLLYELFGIVTNVLGGWVGSQTGLHRTLIAGLTMQVVALLTLSAQQEGWSEWLSVLFVMGAQALSGIAKDLTKMSSKSAVKFVAGEGALFRWVAVLTGSKNALKGVGFFLGGALLAWLGFRVALWTMAGGLFLVLLVVLAFLQGDIGKSKRKTPLSSILSKSAAVNRLSAARLFLFGARDIWFVVALPVFLKGELGWSFQGTGAFLAAWVIGYGAIQSIAPRVLRGRDEIAAARQWSFALAAVTLVMAVLVSADVAVTAVVIVGLMTFGVVFALNSSLHSYLILAYSAADDVAADVGFYYSANATGRLVGTLLSGTLALVGGLEAALWGSTAFLALTSLLSRRLPAIDAAAHAEVSPSP